MQELNKLWHKLNDAIIQVAQKFIPRTKTAPKNFISHTHKATQLYKGLKNINKLLRYLQLNIDHMSNLNWYNAIIKQTNSLTQLEIKEITELSLEINQLPELIKVLKTYQKMLTTARQTENSQVIRTSINNHIQRRYDNFNNNTTKMINSILSRHSELVDLSHIILMDSVITDKNDIKLEVKNHFKN